jgi:hypothetical protein
LRGLARSGRHYAALIERQLDRGVMRHCAGSVVAVAGAKSFSVTAPFVASDSFAASVIEGICFRFSILLKKPFEAPTISPSWSSVMSCCRRYARSGCSWFMGAMVAYYATYVKENVSYQLNDARRGVSYDP